VLHTLRRTGATNAELAHHCVRSLPDGDVRLVRLPNLGKVVVEHTEVADDQAIGLAQ
jgi:hypothetical protein